MEFWFLSPSYELCLTDRMRNLRLLFLYMSTLFYILFLSAFTSTGFDCHTSPVFSPANPESSIEDCLAHLGEKVSQELKEHLHKALESLLSKWVSICFFKGKVFWFCIMIATEMLKITLHSVLHFSFSVSLSGYVLVLCFNVWVLPCPPLWINVNSEKFLSFYHWASETSLSILSSWWN